MRRTLGYNNADVYKSLSRQEKVELWLNAVMSYEQNDEMKDPDTNDEAPEDLWAGVILPPRQEEEKAWKDGVSER